MLTGWKAIAAYLKREERTAMRWASERGLPVHRTPGPGRGSVYAIPAEIDGWLASARTSSFAEPAVEAEAPAAEAPRPRPPRARILGVLAAAVILLLVVVAVLGWRRTGTVAVSGEMEIADPDARAAFLQASYDWNLRTRDSLMRAVHEYGAAIEHDPRAAAAYVGLANSYLLLREDGALSDLEAYPRAEAAARAAVALAPSSAAAHRALAFIGFWWHGDRAVARSEFGQALALAPADALTHHWYATALSANGEREAALREIARARDLDPASTAIIADEGLLLYLSGRQAQGSGMLLALKRDQPTVVAPHRAMADILMWEGRFVEGLRERATVAALRGDPAAEAAEQRFAALPPAAIASTMLADARAHAAAGNWFQLARVASLNGRGDEAAAALARACAAHEPDSVSAAGDLWLSRTLPPARVAALCGGGSLQ